MTLPNFLVIGAQRAGTTLLHNILSVHPEVYVPQRRKEVHYFDWYFDRGIAWYTEFFPDEGEAVAYRAIGEVTPDYLFEPDVPARIRQIRPDCRLIVSLRDPVQRAYSSYLYARRSFNERHSFEDFIEQQPEVLERGRYSEQLSRFFDRFGKDAVLVLILEEFISAPTDHLEQLARFLGLTHGWADPASLLQQRVNDSRAPYFRTAFASARHVGSLLTRNDVDWPVRLAKQLGIPRWFGTERAPAKLSASSRERLQAFYTDEISNLEAVLERDLAVWRACRPSSTP